MAELSLVSSETSDDSIRQAIRNKAKIPWCTSIDEIVIEDMNDYCKLLQQKGVSTTVVRNLIHFYTE